MDSAVLFRCRAGLPGVCLGEAGCGPVCKACTPLVSVDDGEWFKNQYNVEAHFVAEEHRSSCQFICKTVECWEWVRIRCKSGFCHKCGNKRDGGVMPLAASQTSESSQPWALALPVPQQPSHPPPSHAREASPPPSTSLEARVAQSAHNVRRLALHTTGMNLIQHIDAIRDTVCEMRQELDDLRDQTWSFMLNATDHPAVSASSRPRSRSRTPPLRESRN